MPAIVYFVYHKIHRIYEQYAAVSISRAQFGVNYREKQKKNEKWR